MVMLCGYADKGYFVDGNVVVDVGGKVVKSIMGMTHL